MAVKKQPKQLKARQPAKDQTRKQAHGPEKTQRDVTATPSKSSDQYYKDHQGGH